MLNKREKEVIRQIENLLIEVRGATNNDNVRLFAIQDALFNLRRRSLDTTEASIKTMLTNDKIKT